MEKYPVEKITLLDVLNDLGLQDEVLFAEEGTTDITLRSSSIFACVCDEAKTCVSHYNKVREGAVQSQKANLQLLDKWLGDHITRHGSGMAIPQVKAELLLRCLILVFSWVFCLFACFNLHLIFIYRASSINDTGC